MSEEPNVNGKVGARLGVKIAVAVLILCLVGVGAWEYWMRRYAAPPPNALQTTRPGARAAIRLDSTAAPQNPALQPAPPQRYEDTANTINGSDYQTNLACFEHPKSKVDQKLVAMLGADYPDLSEILKSAPHDPKIVRQLLDRLLEAATSAPLEKKPLLLLAADAVAEQLALPSIVPPNPELQRELDALASQGLTFTWVELDGGWFYRSDLLWRLWREFPTREEGEDAFVLLLRQGWDKSPCCHTGADSFHTVIEHGEAFLSNRPKTAHRQEVLFLLAQAYETWWSLSQVPEQNQEEGDPPPAAYRAGAAVAREKAIAYYGEIVEAAPESSEGTCSRKPLGLLRENQDTHQRRFYCYCD
jgi:hypothetical protein